MYEYIYSSVVLFILIYLISFTNFFLILINFNNRDLVYLNSLKDIINTNSMKLLFILILLNIAGVPPTSMFFIKISMLSLIFLKNSVIIFIISFMLIISGMVFYLQLLRFSITKKYKNCFIYKSNYTLFLSPITVLISSLTLINFFLPGLLLDISIPIDLFTLN